MDTSEQQERGDDSQWEHRSDQRFVDYYADASQSAETIARFGSVMEKLLAILGPERAGETLAVADVGCGAGAQAMMWAENGHDVHALDVNAGLIELAAARAVDAEMNVDFRVGTATNLPWSDASMDICLLPELLEHVVEWEKVLDESVRILKPGGLLFLSTSNKLCPIQMEFTLPLYSWYPAPLKRHYEKLSVTTRPELVNHASYPAVNWFTFYSLRSELKRKGMRSLDRFDLIAMTAEGVKRVVARTVVLLPPLRWLAHVATPYTVLMGIRDE